MKTDFNAEVAEVLEAKRGNQSTARFALTDPGSYPMPPSAFLRASAFIPPSALSIEIPGRPHFAADHEEGPGQSVGKAAGKAAAFAPYPWA